MQVIIILELFSHLSIFSLDIIENKWLGVP